MFRWVITSTLLYSFLSFAAIGQTTDANVFGDVQSGDEHIPFAEVFVEGTGLGTTTDETGHYMLINLPEGEHTLVARSLGYKPSRKTVVANAGKTVEVNFELQRDIMQVDQIVVTGTKTFKRQTQAPVIVNVLDRKSIEAVQACNISEGLRFQPGLRVETDCQTCNYSQLRMNGLTGGYSQILINGRPVFSPLIGLYGLEQIPANMVEQIEVVRGGGSALYGSSAIGGTVNVITRIPKSNNYDINYTHNVVNGRATDYVFSGNVNMVTARRNAGAAIFVNHRYREAYDHQGLTLLDDNTTRRERDNYSELPELRNNSFGANLFYRPAPNQKVELNFSSLHEYRYGGEITDKQPHLAQQSEERVHNIIMGGVDYQINFNNENSSFITYAAGQYTDRDHYTGLYPVRDEFIADTLTPEQIDARFEQAEFEHLSNPPYGYTYNTTWQSGVQLNHKIQGFIKGNNVFILGAEYKYDDVLDSIPSYNYGTDQTTQNTSGFIQSDWQIFPSFTLLTGLRADKHNLVDDVIFSPRVSLLYRLRDYTQFRLTWGTGFRAPQAFDTDMHIAFAGGGISRIKLAPDLHEERSNSLSGSVNFDFPTDRYILGFTVEGFYTRLNDAFYLQPLEPDGLGERYKKRNGPGATVQGVTIELRGNCDQKIQLETGYTIQSSRHHEPIYHLDTLAGAESRFLRTPNNYGYAILTLSPWQRFNASLSMVHTGEMLLVKFSPNEEIRGNEYRTSPSFTELSFKMGYTFPMPSTGSGIEVFGGVRNFTNAFQRDFDNGRNRDSNYMYGPAAPRTVYIGLKLKSVGANGL